MAIHEGCTMGDATRRAKESWDEQTVAKTATWSELWILLDLCEQLLSSGRSLYRYKDFDNKEKRDEALREVNRRVIAIEDQIRRIRAPGQERGVRDTAEWNALHDLVLECEHLVDTGRADDIPGVLDREASFMIERNNEPETPADDPDRGSNALGWRSWLDANPVFRGARE